jgi:hypothetical protein
VQQQSEDVIQPHVHRRVSVGFKVHGELQGEMDLGMVHPAGRTIEEFGVLLGDDFCKNVT